ncbi:MAG: putative pterin-4-alpha-carbinolamine dehydratase 1 [Moraxellaceae bacterium]|jgi:4a-hydroxytetrahydrobiopterin dehydratase|nr:putative pterin-4-alpha-carbinolamine dehydratase 1 [Moraxellaceae bacterium]
MSICQPLSPDARALLEAEARTEMRNLVGWHLEQVEETWRLVKTYRTASFLQSLALAERIARLAEAENHHPAIEIAWGRCTVSWWTTRLHGVHANDVCMAAATDELLFGG